MMYENELQASWLTGEFPQPVINSGIRQASNGVIGLARSFGVFDRDLVIGKLLLLAPDLLFLLAREVREQVADEREETEYPAYHF